MAFWFNTNETWYEFPAGLHGDFVFVDPSPESAGDNSRTLSVAFRTFPWFRFNGKVGEGKSSRLSLPLVTPFPVAMQQVVVAGR